jgi:uncharacterized protein (TIGR02466 family)
MNAIKLLFPTPIMIADIESIPEDDHTFLLNAEYHNTDKDGGLFEKTKSTYILKNRQTELISWIQEQLDNFSKDVMATTSKLKITQSWCLKHTNVVQQVYPHNHPNSIVSGAYYVTAPAGTENIRFNKNKQTNTPSIQWEIDQSLLEERPWAWDWEEIPVQAGRLILFPSNLEHMVLGKIVNSNTRCVLSFNTWFDGEFGSEERLTRLGDE